MSITEMILKSYSAGEISSLMAGELIAETQYAFENTVIFHEKAGNC